MVWLLSEHMNRDDLDKCWLCRSASRSLGKLTGKIPVFLTLCHHFTCFLPRALLRAEPQKARRKDLATSGPGNLATNRVKPYNISCFGHLNCKTN